MLATQLWWYTARSAGLVAWGLLAASVLWGLALSTKVFGKRPRPNWLLDLHRFLGGAAVVFVGIHVVSVLFDTFVGFGVEDVLLPFASSWKPTAVAWGIVGMYLLLAIEITSLMRSRLSKRAWRMTHYLSFPLFVMATVHSLSAGTDRNTALMLFAVLGVTALVIALTAIRFVRAERHDLMTSPRVAPGPAPAPRDRTLA